MPLVAYVFLNQNCPRCFSAGLQPGDELKLKSFWVIPPDAECLTIRGIVHEVYMHFNLGRGELPRSLSVGDVVTFKDQNDLTLSFAIESLGSRLLAAKVTRDGRWLGEQETCGQASGDSQARAAGSAH